MTPPRWPSMPRPRDITPRGAGTDWEFMNQGCAGFGLQSEVLPLDEGRMTTALDEAGP